LFCDRDVKEPGPLSIEQYAASVEKRDESREGRHALPCEKVFSLLIGTLKWLSMLKKPDGVSSFWKRDQGRK
jgi:hypothetical protein